MCVCVLCSEAELATCCSVLTKLLDVVDPTAILSNFHSELLVGLDSESETVRHLCLLQVPLVLMSFVSVCLSLLTYWIYSCTIE